MISSFGGNKESKETTFVTHLSTCKDFVEFIINSDHFRFKNNGRIDKTKLLNILANYSIIFTIDTDRFSEKKASFGYYISEIIDDKQNKLRFEIELTFYNFQKDRLNSYTFYDIKMNRVEVLNIKNGKSITTEVS